MTKHKSSLELLEECLFEGICGDVEKAKEILEELERRNGDTKKEHVE